MKYIVTPLCMTEDFLRSDRSDFGYGAVGFRSDYAERPSLTVEAETPNWAAEHAWSTYQNIDEDRRCPDNGRSMMIGDLVHIADETGQDHGHYRVVTCGFKPVSLQESV